ncbi:MAG: hypothetical protein HC819_06350 [Cyclobacteriaceae bacterium]|nr:hypothetical protein [Cyclobacteriaceae bacterium]
MKGKPYISLIILLFTVLLSCEKPEEIIFEGPYHARFTQTSSEILENYKDPFNINFNEPISIELHLAAPSQNNTTIIEYKVGGTAVENQDYILEDGDKKRVLIPVGEHIGNIRYLPINNREQTGDKTLKFTITSVNNGLDAGFGETGVNGRFHTVTIKDDDCLVDLRKFEGIWEFNQNNGEFIYDVEIQVDWASNNTIYMLGYTGLDSGVYAFANLDLCRGEFVIPEQGLAGNFEQLGGTRTDGKGTFDSEVEFMNFSYSYDFAGPSIREVIARKKIE